MKSPYPKITDEEWDEFTKVMDNKEYEAVITRLVNDLWNKENQPQLSIYEIEGRKVAMRWGIRAGMRSHGNL